MAESNAKDSGKTVEPAGAQQTTVVRYSELHSATIDTAVVFRSWSYVNEVLAIIAQVVHSRSGRRQIKNPESACVTYCFQVFTKSSYLIRPTNRIYLISSLANYLLDHCRNFIVAHSVGPCRVKKSGSRVHRLLSAYRSRCGAGLQATLSAALLIRDAFPTGKSLGRN
jgi:hypothetical protein